ncbi:MAG: hypothetical protein HY706_03940 [Candidatus Hydrogenedentes bacterium]|nr:hypothetical protein [Candidatus Hydrogenedentota bacterium]
MRYKGREFEFRIDGYTPKSIPMNRLAEYMAHLASLLGENKSVHFLRVKPGSTCVCAAVENEAEPKVRARLRIAKLGDEQAEETKVVRRLNRLLVEDNACGALTGPDRKKILEFPGKERL